MRCRHTVLAFPSGEGGPAGPDEGQAPATAHSRQTAGGGVPDAPRNLALPPTSAEGSRPLPTDRTIDACLRKPPGRACPAPTARRPGNDCSRKPHSVSISPPSVGRGAPTPPRPSVTARSRANRRGRRPRRPAKPCAAAIQPLPSPSGEGGPAGPDEGQAPPCRPFPGNP